MGKKLTEEAFLSLNRLEFLALWAKQVMQVRLRVEKGRGGRVLVDTFTTKPGFNGLGLGVL